MKEITINPKNLLYHILLRWRLMILLAVIFAVLANCFGIYQSYTAKKKAAALAAAANSASVSGTQSESIIEIKENAMTESSMKLTAKEIYDVDSAIDTYQLYSSEYADIDNYIKNSVLMRLDSKRVPTLSLQYYVNDFYIVQYPVIEKRSYASAVVSTYISSILNEATLSAAAEVYETTPEYARELINVYDKGNFLCVDIIGKDQETCNAVADIIKKRISEIRSSSLTANFGEYEITLATELFTCTVNTDLYDRQLKMINDRNTVRTNRVNVTKEMNDNQKTFFLAKMDYLNAVAGGDSYVSYYTVGDSDDEESDEEENTAPAPVRPVKIKYFDVKLVLAGFLGGILIGFFIALLSYTLTPVVRVSENISDGFKQFVFGTVWLDTKRKKKFLGVIDRLITKWFYGREVGFELSKRIEMLCAGIQIAMEKEGIQNVYLTGASEKGNEIIEQLKESLKDSCNVVSGESVIYNPASLKTLSESESVVFVETAGDSRYEEIAKEIEITRQSKVKVLGFVLLQQ